MATLQQYPWGKASPGMRLRETSARARSGLEKGSKGPLLASGGVESVREAARASQPLCDALEYLARAGLRTRGERDPVEGEDVAAAVQALHHALEELGEASVETVSERYAAYVAAVEGLERIGKQAAASGIAGTGARGTGDAWRAFT